MVAVLVYSILSLQILLCFYAAFQISAQVEHLNRHLEESERALQERIFKLEGQRIQLEEVRVYLRPWDCCTVAQKRPLCTAMSVMSSNDVHFS